jgi:hypothetical protein
MKYMPMMSIDFMQKCADASGDKADVVRQHVKRTVRRILQLQDGADDNSA